MLKSWARYLTKMEKSTAIDEMRYQKELHEEMESTYSFAVEWSGEPKRWRIVKDGAERSDVAICQKCGCFESGSFGEEEECPACGYSGALAA